MTSGRMSLSEMVSILDERAAYYRAVANRLPRATDAAEAHLAHAQRLEEFSGRLLKLGALKSPKAAADARGDASASAAVSDAAAAVITAIGAGVDQHDTGDAGRGDQTEDGPSDSDGDGH